MRSTAVANVEPLTPIPVSTSTLYRRSGPSPTTFPSPGTTTSSLVPCTFGLGDDDVMCRGLADGDAAGVRRTTRGEADGEGEGEGLADDTIGVGLGNVTK